jgi:branched-chain amino acid transport system substrate-binding protein
MHVRKHKGLLALFVVLILVVAACGGDDGEASGEPIVIGAVFDLSGPTADVGTPYSEGVLGYVAWLNDAGGIDGRPIEVKHQDYQYDVAQAETLYSQYVSEGAVAFMGWGTGDTEALRTRVTEDEIPFMSASYSEALTDPGETPYNFVVGTSYSDQMRVALRWIDENFDGHAEISVFHHDSPFGTSPVADGEAYIGDEGFDMGYASYPMPGGVTDYIAELSQAQTQGVTHIIVQNVSSPAATLAKNIDEQGLDVTMICLNWCADEGFVSLAGAAAEGVHGVLPFGSPTSGGSGFDVADEWLTSQGSSLDDKGLHYTQGWWSMAAMAEAIKKVVDDGDDVTGPNIKAALESLSGFDTGGVTVDIGFTADSHKGMPGASVFEVSGGVWSVVADNMMP